MEPEGESGTSSRSELGALAEQGGVTAGGVGTRSRSGSVTREEERSARRCSSRRNHGACGAKRGGVVDREGWGVEAVVGGDQGAAGGGGDAAVVVALPGLAIFTQDGQNSL
jgi:hypothetical protein